MIRSWYGPGLLLSVLLLAGGCSGGKKEDKTVQVNGTVEMDGKPLPDGEVIFVGDGGTVPDMLPVNAGAFEGKVKVGKKKVEVRAYKIEKPPPSATGGVTETKVNYIPARYNSSTTLTAEVGDSGVTPNKFEVKSK